jgi:hypothetical protein
MSNTLILDWQEDAVDAKCNFCAIEVGEAAESDTDLPELLHAYVPQDAHVYILQRDANVSGEEIEQLREVLDRLEIPLASDEPSRADDVHTWVFPVLDEVATAGRVGWIDDRIAAEKKQREHNREAYFKLNREAQDQDEALRLAMEKAGISPGQEAGLPTFIMNAFNELQFSKYWQALADTPGAKAVYWTMREIYRLDEGTQSHVEGLLHTLLLGMRDDPGTLGAVLSAAEKLTDPGSGVFALSKMCIAYMEHRVASGALDDKLSVALDFARCVQRYELLGEACANELKVARILKGRSSPLEVELQIAFEDASIAVLRDGGKRGLPPQEEDPTPAEAAAADIVQAAWQEMLKRGNEGFQKFLTQWKPWGALASRRAERLAAERQSQQAMN